MQNKWIFAFVFFIAGCSVSAPPTQIEPVQIIPTATPTPAPSPTAARTAYANALEIFPLRRGAQWVYQEIAYDTIPNDVLPQRTNRQITATLLITDTVLDTQTRDGMYAAQVVRDRGIVSTTLDLALLGEYGSEYFANNAPATKWYIFTENKIFSQFESENETLNWDTVEKSNLEYRLPLHSGDCWYPDSDSQLDCTANDPTNTIPGFRVVESLVEVRAPAGVYHDCFRLYDVYNGGYLIQDFCPGTGIVGEHFDHAGTPFGTHSALRKFTPGE